MQDEEQREIEIVDEDIDDGTDVPTTLSPEEQKALRNKKLRVLKRFLNRNKLLLTSD